ncbi:LCP family protein [Lacisediminihabitans sp. G11-30]|uniref:LCP family protein n=2 Tax=Lacisediminihabitans changchengi TaxID=2787634 RepID=A0A934SLM1_9MICO|nr:LCP family protein [Lacisediminihabitans changchengi]MBK4348891.1 LCP family protein [Lacisediminihabitans changchengi]
MARRAWWLVALNLLIPGSAQLLAGNRKVGRFAVSTTFFLWGLALVALVTWLVAHTAIYSIVTSVIGLTALQVLFAAFAILWTILTLDTLRMVRLVKLAPAAGVLVAFVTVAGLVLTAGSAGYAAVSTGAARSALSQIFGGSSMATPVDGRYNILLLGGDAGPDRTGLRPDSTSVASVDAVTGATTIIGIPRNLEKATFTKGSPLWGPFPDGYNCGDQCLIDYIYTYAEEHPSLYPKATEQGSSPGIQAMMDAAGGVTGLTIQYFALIDMQGFADLVDAVGGVTVDVPARLAYGPVTAKQPYGYFEAGKQHLDGALALWYGRSRYNGSDFDRMERQRQVQTAIIQQVQPSVVVTKFQEIAAAGAQVIKTDVPTAAIPGFIDLAGKGRKLPVTQLELVPPQFDNGNPNYDKIHAAVKVATSPVTATPTP